MTSLQTALLPNFIVRQRTQIESPSISREESYSLTAQFHFTNPQLDSLLNLSNNLMAALAYRS